MKHYLFLSLLVCFSANSYIGTGTYTEYAFTAQNDPEGGSNKFDFNPYVSLFYKFNLWNQFKALPEIGYVHYLDEADDYSKKTFFLNYNFAYEGNRELYIFGFGTIINRISGDGGTVVIDGQSFFRPSDEGQSSYTPTANVGYEFFWQQNLSARLLVHIMQPLDSAKRKISYLLGVNFYAF